MNGAVLGLAGTILLVLSAVVVALLKSGRGSPESRTADAQAWSLLNGGLVSEVSRLRTQMTGMEESVKTANTDSAAARKDASAAREEVAELAKLLDFLFSWVAPVVDWLDGGAKPPSPIVPARLREVLAELAANRRTPPPTS